MNDNHSIIIQKTFCLLSHSFFIIISFLSADFLPFIPMIHQSNHAINFCHLLASCVWLSSPQVAHALINSILSMSAFLNLITFFYAQFCFFHRTLNFIFVQTALSFEVLSSLHLFLCLSFSCPSSSHQH